MFFKFVKSALSIYGLSYWVVVRSVKNTNELENEMSCPVIHEMIPILIYLLIL